MMENSNNINYHNLTDLAIARQVGSYLKNIRLQKNLTQEQIAKKSGLYRSTVSEIENGRPASFLSFVQLLRTLDLLYFFDFFTIKNTVSPLEMAKIEAKKRKRASKNINFDTKPESTW